MVLRHVWYCSIYVLFLFTVSLFLLECTSLVIWLMDGRVAASLVPRTVPWILVQSLSHVQLLVTPWTVGCQASCPSLSSRVCSNSHPLSRWCHPTISSSSRPLLPLPSIFPSNRVFSNELALRIRWPSIGASASASVLPMCIQDWFPLGLTDLISLLSKGLSSIFSRCPVYTCSMDVQLDWMCN